MRTPILLLAAALAASAADDWPMAFHDARHSGRTAEVVTPPLTLAWTWKDSIAYDNDPKWASQSFPWLPIYYQGRLYVQGGLNANRLFAIDPAAGKVLWEVDNPGYTASGTYLFQFDNYPAAVARRILSSSTDFTLSMDAATGGDVHNIYNTNGGWPYGAIALWKQRAILQFVETDNGAEDLRVVNDPVSLSTAGFYSAPDRTTTFTDISFRVPAVDNNVVYAERLGQLVAWDAASASDLWTWGSRNFGVSPAVWNRILFFYASSQNLLVAIDTSALTSASYALAGIPVLWTAPIAGAAAPIASDGTVYTGSSDGNFYALDAQTGAVKWKLPTRAAFSAVQVPAISGSLIYIPGADGVLYVLNKDSGEEAWRYTGTAAFGPVVIGGGRVFVCDATSTLYGFQAAGAAMGPAVSALTVSRVAGGVGTALGITGEGFTGATAVQLNDAAGTTLTGFQVDDDGTITGATLPASIVPGRYRVSVTTPAGRSVDGPELEVAPAGSFLPAILGISQGPYDHGTDQPFQRHLARLKDGTLVAAYPGRRPDPDQGDLWQVYQISRDGGRTWTQPTPFYTGGQGSSVIWAASLGLTVSAANQVQATVQQWPSYQQKFGLYNYDGGDFLTPAATTPSAVSGAPLYPGPMVTEPSGKIWIAYAVLHTPGGSASDVYASYSADGGNTWAQTPMISKANGTSPAMALYNGLPLVVYTEGATLAWSAWSGSQWSAPQALSGSISGAGVNLSMTNTSDGKVQLTAGSSSGLLYLSFAGDWSVPLVLDAGGTSPSLTTDGVNLWCFYATVSNNIAYRHWSPSANAWDPAVAVTGDTAVHSRPSTLPLSPDSTIPVIWTVGSAPPYEVRSAVVPAQPAAAALEVRASVASAPVAGTSATLIASPAGGSPPYTFTWTAPAGVSLSSGNTGSPAATFAKAGIYQLGLTVRDSAGASASTTAEAAVVQAPASVTVAAPPPPMVANVFYKLAASVTDQFGSAVSPILGLAWTVTPSTGTFDSTGNFAAFAPGSYKVTATVPGGPSGSASFTVGAAGSVALAIANVTVASVTQGSAVIQWTTNDLSDSQVDYGFTTDYVKTAGTAAGIVNHSVTLSGLTPGKPYHFRVRSKNAGGSAASGDFEFTTLGAARPSGR
jgi:outer membrane protein assembly factor BamB